ncbi:YaiI/YqxD family protein [soil metagenome]
MPLPSLFIDADACPVKDEVYRVAARYGLKVFVVSNSWINTPREPWIEQVVVDAGPDIADDWIAERAVTGDVVITADIPLADRCLKSGAQAIKSNGQPFTPDSIGSALAGRMVGEHLRSMGVATSGPPPFGPRDRSNFLQALDQAVVRAKKTLAIQPSPPPPSTPVST